MSRKLLLINPVNQRLRKFHVGHTVNIGTRLPPLGLGIVAALTPDTWDIEIIDENFTPFVFKNADLVGLTAFTATAPRAYEIARIYKKKKIPTVIGGIHASLMPEEALKNADSVVVGEAEGVWHQLIEHYEKGTIKRVYEGARSSLTQLPRPRRDLFDKGYRITSIETSRGCLRNCEFCSVPAFYGHTHRFRPVGEVLDELATISQRRVFFTDDNLLGHGEQSRERALALFKGMIKRGLQKEWICQASMDFAEDERVLEYAARSGCRMVFLGVEAYDHSALEKICKKTNLAAGINAYERIFRRIHEYGICVLGSFMYGMDCDDAETLRKRTQSINKSSIDVVQISYLTPLPGTRFFARLKDENRLLYKRFPDDWERYTMAEVTYAPAAMRSDDLINIQTEVVPMLFNYPRIFCRCLKTLRATKKLSAALWAWQFNIIYRNTTIRSKRLRNEASRKFLK